jgi:hypothetical protein
MTRAPIRKQADSVDSRDRSVKCSRCPVVWPIRRARPNRFISFICVHRWSSQQYWLSVRARIIETFLPQCWQSIVQWNAFGAPSRHTRITKETARIRILGRWMVRQSVALSDESRDKVAHNFNSSAGSVKNSDDALN